MSAFQKRKHTGETDGIMAVENQKFKIILFVILSGRCIRRKELNHLKGTNMQSTLPYNLSVTGSYVFLPFDLTK